VSTVAQELRALSTAALELCRQSSVNSIAYPGFSALADYLCLQARIMEMEEEGEHLREVLDCNYDPFPRE